jgi:O-antigen/teichoic acid export membrane protein
LSATSQEPEAPAGQTAGYARATGVLSIGLAVAGLITFAFFSLASHSLSAQSYTRIVVLWSVMFIVICTIYRPIEQLLSRTIAHRRASGAAHDHPLRVPAAIQIGFGMTFVLTALLAREPIQQGLFDGSGALYWALIAGVTTYGAAYFARGWLAGYQRYTVLGALVLFDAIARVCFPLAVVLGFPLAVVLGIGGEATVALGVAAAPVLSLLVVPLAFGRRVATLGEDHGSPLAPAADAALEGPGAEGAEEAYTDLTLAHGAGFAFAVLGIMLAEQALLNFPVLAVNAVAGDAALAGFVFNVLLISRAPLQLFQAVQLSLLPHLAGLEATQGRQAFHHAVWVTALAIGAFTAAVAAGLALVGPAVMSAVFGSGFEYARGGLVLMGLGMGLHLFAGTLNQAALARGRAGASSLAWLGVAALFVAWLMLAPVADLLLRVQIGYFAATGLLSLALLVVVRGHARRDAAADASIGARSAPTAQRSTP